MSGLSKLTPSFFSATNENTLALANFNLDFALIKFEAPKEFNGLGTSLSTARRNNAEDGPLHKTLRKLGCLFEQILPSTPKLIQAYGLRTSEIIQSPGISPKGSRSHGPFEQFIGADGTSIWAAATSGPAALSVHLLACMLARQFDDSKIGVAILVELVVERQREIQEAMKNNHIVSISTVMASQQEISREELAAFDASARSWLCSADEAKMSPQKKLMLILRNINTRISGGTSTYKTVIEAWKQAMLGLEDLLGGMPQQVSNGAVLRALSSWHLFPNLIVLVDKIVNVKFEDPLFSEQAVVTVGLQSSDGEHDTGIQWSLTLSHLRYYGDPVAVETDGNDSRVDMKQLHMVIFGSLLGLWRVPAEEVREVAVWFQVLWNTLEVAVSKEVIASALPWLRTMVEIADEVLVSQGDDWETSRLLVHYGSRRASRFLTEQWNTFRPFFGLGNPYVLATLELNIDHGIQYLRQAAVSLNVKDREIFIMYSETLEDGVYFEVATALKHTRLSSKRSEDGSMKGQQVHARWIYSKLSFPSASGPSCSCQRGCSDNCPCRDAGLFCGKACHSKGKACHGKCKRPCHAHPLSVRLQQLSDQGEEAFLIRKGPITFLDKFDTVPKSNKYMWRSPPVLYGPLTGLGCGATGDAASSISRCQCFETRKQRQEAVNYNRVAGFGEGFGLYARYARFDHDYFKSPMKDLWSRRIEKESMLQHVSGPNAEHKRLFQFLQHIAGNYNISGESRLPKLSTFIQEGRQHPAALSSLRQLRELVIIPPSFIKSLQAISFANWLYDGMTAASIPLRLVEQPIYENHWIPHETAQRDGFRQPSQAQAIACILTFESGGVHSDPKQLESVMAISSRNSIFITGTLLSGPAKVVKGPDIRRVVGNVGKPGITLLVSPQNLRIKPPGRDFRVIPHADYDYQRLDSFSGTSLHLSFTNWMVPLNDGEYGLIDQDIFLAEAVVSVRDRGRWIADIDVIGARPKIHGSNIGCQCNNGNKSSSKVYISIDSWEELLDPPLAIGIFRAHGNWAARLAAICILKQKKADTRVYLLDKEIACLACVEDQEWTDGRGTALFID